jgi:hypothetical protein
MFWLARSTGGILSILQILFILLKIRPPKARMTESSAILSIQPIL